MRPVAFQSVVLTTHPGHLPISLVQTSAKPSGLIRLAIIAGLASAVVLPQIWLATCALASSDIRALLLAKPMTTAQLAIALTFWIAVFAWPLKALFSHLTRRRDVTIDRTTVSVCDYGLSGIEAWQEPVSSFAGLAHHIRTSLSGVRHELVLVHRNRDKSVIVLASDYISETEYSSALHLLGVPRVPSASVYGLAARTAAPVHPHYGAQALPAVA